MLDHLSHGRAEIGVGRGVSPFELKYNKVDPEKSRDIFIDAYRCIAKGLTTDMLTYKGPHYEYENVPIALQPAAAAASAVLVRLLGRRRARPGRARRGCISSRSAPNAARQGQHRHLQGGVRQARRQGGAAQARVLRRHRDRRAAPHLRRRDRREGARLGEARDEQASRAHQLDQEQAWRDRDGGAHANTRGANYEECVEEGTVIAGSPKTVLAGDRAPRQGDRLQLSADLSLPRQHVVRHRHALAQAVHRRGDARRREDVSMDAKRERIQPDKLHVRKSGDKVLYSQVMVVEVGGTRQIFVAGQTPRDRDGNCVGKGDMRRADRAGRREHQGRAGSRRRHARRHREDHDLRHRHGRVLQAPGRAHALFRGCAADQHHRQVARLSRPEFMVEIEAFAIV